MASVAVDSWIRSAKSRGIANDHVGADSFPRYSDGSGRKQKYSSKENQKNKRRRWAVLKAPGLVCSRSRWLLDEIPGQSSEAT